MHLFYLFFIPMFYAYPSECTSRRPPMKGEHPPHHNYTRAHSLRADDFGPEWNSVIVSRSPLLDPQLGAESGGQFKPDVAPTSLRHQIRWSKDVTFHQVRALRASHESSHTKKPKHSAFPQGTIRDKGQQKSAEKSASSVKGIVDNVWNGLKGIGKQARVVITWYTGDGLLNPSCWPNSNWAPTDQSFVAAVTLHGWSNHPQCFQFLELCNGPTKCVFVRVVDSCAGCAAGSQAVDLTKAAFSQLADINEGRLEVQMRSATTPRQWHEDLWGPQEHS